MGEQAPPAGDLAQLEAAVRLLVLDLELGQERRRLTGSDVERLRERASAHRVARHQEQRLERRFGRKRVQLLQIFHLLYLTNPFAPGAHRLFLYGERLARMVLGGAGYALDHDLAKVLLLGEQERAALRELEYRQKGRDELVGCLRPGDEVAEGA